MAFWIRQAEKEITEKLVAQDFEGDVRRRMEQDIGGVVENEIFPQVIPIKNQSSMGICWEIVGYFWHSQC